MNKIVYLYALMLLTCVFSVSQLYSQYANVKDDEFFYRDSEQWIRERQKWFYEQRAFPLGYVPEGLREAAWAQTQKMKAYQPPASLSKNTLTSASSWTLVGPINIGGRVTGIAIDPVNSQNVYFTAADGGVWKSTNGGASFSPVVDNLATMAMGSIAIDPSNPNTIFVGTGEANFSSDSYGGIGVIKSTDGGATWSQAGTMFSNKIGRVAVHPTNGSIVLAASTGGLYRSSNAGSTWTQVRAGTTNDVAINPSNPNIMFAGGSSFGVVKSTDAGLTWAQMNNGIPIDSLGGRIALDICDGTPTVVYAVFVKSSGGSLRGVYKTTNGGTNWVATTVTNPNFFGTQGWYDISVSVDPSNPNRVLVGGISLYGSTDGGYTWTLRTIGHVDQHASEFDPTNPTIVYQGNDGGMYKSTNSGTSFSSLNSNLPITQFYELGVAEQNASIMVGGTQDNGSKKGSGSLNWTHVSGADGGYGVIDYTNANIIYTEYQYGSHRKSTNGGASDFSINIGIVGSGLWVTPVVIHPTNPLVLFTATTKQMYKTTNGGTLWFPFHGSTDSTSAIYTIAISSVNPQYMIRGRSDGKIFLSTNAGASWTNISTGLPTKTCTKLVFHPTDPAIFFASYSGSGGRHVYRSTNSGTSWTDLTNNLPDIPTNCIAVNPYVPNILYVGTDLGVYISEDGGATWQSLQTGLPRAVVVDLDIHKASGLIRAATHGRSVYELAIALPVEMTSFTGEIEGENVLLKWRTQTETNNRGFSLERRIGDDGAWSEVAFIDGHGTVGYPNFYQYRDPLSSFPMQQAKLVYRLTQIDYDGTNEYSPEIIVHVNRTELERYTLDQNYPNPFNPVTNIRYTIPRAGPVKIIVQDNLGSEVATLVDEYKQPGEYVAHFDASAFPSGGYFYQLIAGGSRIARKMLYLK